jgi:hypothetical protein
MKREEATETPAPTPSRLMTLAPTVADVIGPAYWTFVHPAAHPNALAPALRSASKYEAPAGAAVGA